MKVKLRFILSLLFICLSASVWGQNSQLDKGMEAYRSKEYEKAIAIFTKAIKKDKMNALAYYYRGLTEDTYASELNKNNTAAIEKIKNSSIKYTGLALDDYNKAIILDPKNVLYLLTRASLYWNLPDKKKAQVDFIKVIALDSFNIEARMCLAESLDDTSALQQYKKIQSLHPEIPITYYLIGLTFEKLAEKNNSNDLYNECLKNCTKAIDMGYTFADVYFTRGRIQFKIFNKKEEGCVDLKKASALGSVKAIDFLKGNSCP